MPIINPWIIYLIHVLGSVGSIALMTLLASGAVLMLTGTLYLCDGTHRALVKSSAVIVLISATFSIFIPDEGTMVKMMVAQNVTVERVDVAKEVVEKVYNDIMNKFDKK